MENNPNNEKPKTTSAPVPITAPGTNSTGLTASTSPAFVNKPKAQSAVIFNTPPVEVKTATQPHQNSSLTPTASNPTNQKNLTTLWFLLAGLCTVGIITWIILVATKEDKKFDPGLLNTASLQEADKASSATLASKPQLITILDGSSDNNEGWIKRNPALIRIVDDNGSLATELRSRNPIMTRSDQSFAGRKPQPTTTGFKYSLTPFTQELYDKGWRITYKMKPGRGLHRIGFTITESNNPGWDGDDVSCLLIIDATPKSVKLYSPLNSKYQENPSKSVMAPHDPEQQEWLTIEIEQEPASFSGDFKVTVNGKYAYTDQFLKNITLNGLGYWDNHLYCSLLHYRGDAVWEIKEIKLETL